MPNYLFTGAGFSRNWGGWLADEAFEYLLGCPEITKGIRDWLWASKRQGLGFEHALERLRFSASIGPQFDGKEDVPIFQDMLESMFAAMNAGFKDLEFGFFPPGNSIGHKPNFISPFLSKFDAIFTLNQDSLLEMKYAREDLHRHSEGRWREMYCPGVQESAPGLYSPNLLQMTPRPGCQPYYKLHGSCDWRENDNTLLIMGENKIPGILGSDLIKSLHSRFYDMLCGPDVCVLIVGYGFRDPHINSTIEDACRSGTKLFIVDPRGVDVLGEPPAENRAPPDFKYCWSIGIAGASRRPLSEIFSRDLVERAKLMRFLGASATA